VAGIAALPVRERRYCAAWYRGLLPRPQLQVARHAIERPFQAGILIAAAASLPAAYLFPTAPPQREGIAIAPLLHRLFDREAPRVFHRAQLRFALLPRLQHGQRHGQVVVGAVVVGPAFVGTIHDQALPFSRRAVAPEFLMTVT
jgi:hypothetical protein